MLALLTYLLKSSANLGNFLRTRLIETCNSATALGTCARPPFALRTGAQRIDGIGGVSAALVSKHKIVVSK